MSVVFHVYRGWYSNQTSEHQKIWCKHSCDFTKPEFTCMFNQQKPCLLICIRYDYHMPSEGMRSIWPLTSDSPDFGIIAQQPNLSSIRSSFAIICNSKWSDSGEVTELMAHLVISLKLSPDLLTAVKTCYVSWRPAWLLNLRHGRDLEFRARLFVRTDKPFTQSSAPWLLNKRPLWGQGGMTERKLSWGWPKLFCSRLCV